MEKYRAFSYEELRLADYNAGKKFGDFELENAGPLGAMSEGGQAWQKGQTSQPERQGETGKDPHEEHMDTVRTLAMDLGDDEIRAIIAGRLEEIDILREKLYARELVAQKRKRRLRRKKAKCPV